MRSELSCSAVVEPRHPAPPVVREKPAEAGSTSKALLKLPHLWIKEDRLYCDGQELAFYRAGRRIALLKAFLAGHNHQLSRAQIITIVYGESQLRRRSLRYAECLNSNILRTLSDTRQQLYAAYTSRYPHIDWLHFNKGEKKWKLLRLRDDYVLARLNAQIFASQSLGDLSVPRSDWH